MTHGDKNQALLKIQGRENHLSDQEDPASLVAERYKGTVMASANQTKTEQKTDELTVSA